MARVAFTLCGFIVGVCFPLSALIFARLAGGALGTTDFIGYAAQAHAAVRGYYLIDTAPLVLAGIAFFIGTVQDRMAQATTKLTRENRVQRKNLTKIAHVLEERKKWDAQRVQHAFYDSVTRLANRALFTNRAEHALLRAGSKKHEIAMLLIDLDDFKNVNDTLGHQQGNDVLLEAARRFSKSVRPGDTLARLAADEFVLLLDRVKDDIEIATIAQSLMDALEPPMSIGDRTVRISASVGIARGRRDSNVETILRDAGLAMHEAKDRGKGCMRVFRTEMHEALVERVKLGGEIGKALEHEEFFVMYQPIVDLFEDRVVGMEALVRWNHPKRGIITPLTFIKLAEDTNLIVPLGSWVLHTACRRTAQWLVDRAPDQPLTITVNVSPLQLHSRNFVADVKEALAGSGLQPESLILEITESGLVAHTEDNVALFGELKALGVRLAIDDFGTGYSSLSYLQRFPFDVLKIDKSFVDGVAGGGTDAAFARTIIALGGMLNLRVLAEGVEHTNQRTMLKELGCRYGQGYLFAQPLDVAAMARMLAVPAAAPLKAGAFSL